MQWKCFLHIPVRASKPPASHFTVYLTFYMNIIVHLESQSIVCFEKDWKYLEFYLFAVW